MHSDFSQPRNNTLQVGVVLLYLQETLYTLWHLQLLSKKKWGKYTKCTVCIRATVRETFCKKTENPCKHNVSLEMPKNRSNSIDLNLSFKHCFQFESFWSQRFHKVKLLQVCCAIYNSLLHLSGFLSKKILACKQSPPTELSTVRRISKFISRCSTQMKTFRENNK